MQHTWALAASFFLGAHGFQTERACIRGGVCRVWGVNNKEAPVRLCTLADSSSRDFEFKALDATANPYLALAALLTAGLLVSFRDFLCTHQGSQHIEDHRLLNEPNHHALKFHVRREMHAIDCYSNRAGFE